MGPDTSIRVVKNRSFAYKLRLQGFKIIKTEPNRYRPQYDVYVFDRSPELDEALSKLIREKLNAEDKKTRRQFRQKKGNGTNIET